jgi:hypothetical protein
MELQNNSNHNLICLQEMKVELTDMVKFGVSIIVPTYKEAGNMPILVGKIGGGLEREYY